MTQEARFQSAFLELLAADLPLSTKLRRLEADPDFAPFRAYVTEIEPSMLEVAALLCKRWGRVDVSGSGETAP